MKAVVVQFDTHKARYARLLHVFINSWEKNAKIPLEVHRIKPPLIGKRHKSFYFNHSKLKTWIDSVDQDTIFIDCDMLCMADISNGFDLIKHIGYTSRTNKFPFNGGVVFVKNTPESHKFLKKWYDIDGKMLNNVSLHQPYNKIYAGMNQASMGWMLKNGYEEYITFLPDIYNKCDNWDNWQQAKMIHIKGKLRRICLNGNRRITPDLRQLHKIWEHYKNEAFYSKKL